MKGFICKYEYNVHKVTKKQIIIWKCIWQLLNFSTAEKKRVNRNYFMKNKYTQRGKIFVVFVCVCFLYYK